MQPRKLKKFIWSAAALTAGCWAYSAATRFTDFLFASRLDKVSIMGALLILTSLISACLYWVLLPRFAEKITIKIASRGLGLCLLILALVFLIFYKLPPFPEQHKLEISGIEKTNPLSTGSKVEINSIKMVILPASIPRMIPVNQLDLQGDWQGINNGYGILAMDGQHGYASFQRFMQAGISVEFRTGPDAGMVRLFWDGDEQIQDLYSPEPGFLNLSLNPKLNLRQADLTRKLLVGGALLTDFIGLSVLSFFFGLLLYQLVYRRQWVVRQPGLIIISSVLILVLLAAVSSSNTPVVFENKQIEALVRNTLDKPDGNIYRHQLLTIVKLNTSNRKITSLKGIEQLPNLMQLNLKDNQITDISPVSQLKYLKKLNLRNNGIKDLTPLAQLTGLTYLNIHSNPAIESIAPLKNLIKLKTLIMGDVPIRNEYSVLANFQNLKYLNMRNCGVNDLEIISKTSSLEYLNLYSNPNIFSISPLQNLKNLRTLILANIAVGDELEVLGNLPELSYLNLRNTGLTDLAPLTQLTNLEYLNLHSNPNISSIIPLKNLLKLKTLVLRDVPVGNEVAILRDLYDLGVLNLRNCQIKDISVIGELMARGALQNNPKLGRVAAVDIRENLIPRGSEDHYASVRPYWANISDRQPVSLPFFAALHEPKFSHAAGFYEDGFHLELSTDEPESIIHFTLDGSEPSENSPVYSEPILITSRAGEPNTYSAIESIAADWKKPESEVFKASIVRAKAFSRHSDSTSATITNTYFIGANIQDRYNLPVVSLVTDPKNLFDNETGIYVLGAPYEEQQDADLTEDERQTFANYNQHGRDWERPISIEVFEDGGEVAFNQKGGVRIHGGGSRRYPQKTLRFYAGSEYDLREFFDYPLFSGKLNEAKSQSAPVYKMFLLRNSGQDWNKSMFRDAFVQNLVSQTRLDTQAGRPVVGFLNGEYWGIYTLQEKYDEYYLTDHYGVDPEQVVILRQNGVLYRGNPDDEKPYASLLSYIRKNSLSDPRNYDTIQTQMDVENYIDYLIAEIYAGNDDWPDNNIYLWRLKTDRYEADAPYGQDGRWRWMLFDMDFGFGLQGGAEDYKLDTIEVAQQPGWSGFLFRSLLENEEFRTAFINRFADQLNTSFIPERAVSILDQTQAALRPEMEEFLRRWEPGNDSLEEWEDEVDVMRTFALNRPEVVRQHIVDQFGLQGTAVLTVKTDTAMGYVKVNSIAITPGTQGVVNPAEWSGIYFKGVPVTITAVPKPGYKFAGWEGIEQEGNVITLNLQKDITLTANFV